MKRNFLAFSGASILILAGVALTALAMAQAQPQAQDQSQAQPQDQSQAQDQSQDQTPMKATHMRHRISQTAREDRSENRITAQLNEQQLAQAGSQNASGGTVTNTGYTAQPNSTQQGAQRPDDNPQTDNCVAAGSGGNCSTPTPNSNNGASPGSSK